MRLTRVLPTTAAAELAEQKEACGLPLTPTQYERAMRSASLADEAQEREKERRKAERRAEKAARKAAL